MQSWLASRCGLALLVFACGCATAPVRASNYEPAPEGADANEIAARADDVTRGERTLLEGKMIIRSRRLSQERVLQFKRYSDRARKRALVRILEPETDRGTGYLEHHPNLWMYVPRVERTMRIPPTMMRKPWMDGDFTNDELATHSSEVEDYEQRLLGVDSRPEFAPDLRAYVLEYVPHGDSPALWPRIVAWIEVEHGTPLRREFYDEEGGLERVVGFGDIREVKGRHFPHVWFAWPMREEGHSTVIEVEQLHFDADFDDSVFTTHHLKAGATP